MRIAVVIPAYYRPRQLLACLTALEELRTRKHAVQYIVAVDEEDGEVREVLRRFGWPLAVRMYSQPAPPSLGKKINDAMVGVAADAYAFMADDKVPITLGWDGAIENIFTTHRLPAFCWHETADSGNTTYPVISDAMLQALGGKFFCEWFPYWFIDTWLDEVHILAFGDRLPIIEDLLLAGLRGKTSNGLRDVDFWFKFFAATRPQRIEEARKVAAFFGLPTDIETLRADRIKRLEALDAKQLENVPWYLSQMGRATGDPSQRYMLAKSAAEAHLRTLELETT